MYGKKPKIKKMKATRGVVVAKKSKNSGKSIKKGKMKKKRMSPPITKKRAMNSTGSKRVSFLSHPAAGSKERLKKRSFLKLDADKM